MNAKNPKLLLLSFLFIAGCEERIELPPSGKETNTLVVEGMITNEKTNHWIQLTLPHAFQNEAPFPVSGATITILEDDIVYNLTEYPARSGRYYTPEMRAVTGKTYTLQIQYRDKTYVAKDSSVPVEPLQPLQYQQTGDGYSLVFGPSGQDPNFITHYLSWRNTDQCGTGSTCEAVVMYHDLKTADVNEIYKPAKEDLVLPLNAVVVRKKYSVSPAYRTFLRSVLSETEWRGGVFDVERSNVSTNLSDGAIGFFAVSTVVSDTTVIVQKP